MDCAQGAAFAFEVAVHGCSTKSGMCIIALSARCRRAQQMQACVWWWCPRSATTRTTQSHKLVARLVSCGALSIAAPVLNQFLQHAMHSLRESTTALCRGVPAAAVTAGPAA